eukprot:TRINITY_DN1829_c0_g1_i4.p3 TRINITY_DN1829_c0_g1~~TRINITY_DN1829_c0_g1_i4.p3  ORF type:complete len:103 (+),score=10.21 TRINITY_DN1829_c0_g1_i4:274-582(+)
MPAHLCAASLMKVFDGVFPPSLCSCKYTPYAPMQGLLGFPGAAGDDGRLATRPGLGGLLACGRLSSTPAAPRGLAIPLSPGKLPDALHPAALLGFAFLPSSP